MKLRPEWLDATFGERLAPDGTLVRENFQRWFGASKVVDECGSPAVLYHGTSRTFEAFDRKASMRWRRESMDTIGSWFSSEPARAERYAGGDGWNVVPVFLRIERPKVYRTFDAFLDQMHLAAGRDPRRQAPKGVGSTDELRFALMAAGYDGIRFQRTSNGELQPTQRTRTADPGVPSLGSGVCAGAGAGAQAPRTCLRARRQLHRVRRPGCLDRLRALADQERRRQLRHVRSAVPGHGRREGMGALAASRHMGHAGSPLPRIDRRRPRKDARMNLPCTNPGTETLGGIEGDHATEAKVFARWFADSTVVDVPDAMRVAAMYADQYNPGEPGHADPRSLRWLEVGDYPIDRLLDAVDTQWFLAEQQMWADEGEPDRFADMLRSPIAVPVVIFDDGTGGWTWDGNHRIGAVLTKGQRTIRALVGVRPQAIREALAEATLLEQPSGECQQERCRA